MNLMCVYQDSRPCIVHAREQDTHKTSKHMQRCEEAWRGDLTRWAGIYIYMYIGGIFRSQVRSEDPSLPPPSRSEDPSLPSEKCLVF